MNMNLFALLNTPEILLIVVLAIILFGAKKLPELARGLGQGIKEFRRVSREEEPRPTPKA
jgi:sec-independent protein translocase protein TatA